MTARIAPDRAVQGVLAVLSGTALRQAAAEIGMDPDELADAAEVYRAAGRAALESRSGESWYQVRVQFADWDTAEQTAARWLNPAFQHAENGGVLDRWWFIRKSPCWRMRFRVGVEATMADLEAAIGGILDRLTTAGEIVRWRPTIYEPENVAFGGQLGMDIAHRLFHADSTGTLDYLRRHDAARSGELSLGRRELSVLLCGALLQGAGQEWHEQAACWHGVTQLRPLPPETPLDRLRDLAGDLQGLLSIDAAPTSGLYNPSGPLGHAAPWATGFDQAGHALGEAAADGTLQRGLRDVLAHHIIFHWNRLGLPTKTQAILARAARDAMLNPPVPDVVRIVESANVARS